MNGTPKKRYIESRRYHPSPLQTPSLHLPLKFLHAVLLNVNAVGRRKKPCKPIPPKLSGASKAPCFTAFLQGRPFNFIVTAKFGGCMGLAQKSANTKTQKCAKGRKTVEKNPSVKNVQTTRFGNSQFPKAHGCHSADMGTFNLC